MQNGMASDTMNGKTSDSITASEQTMKPGIQQKKKKKKLRGKKQDMIDLVQEREREKERGWKESNKSKKMQLVRRRKRCTNYPCADQYKQTIFP
jgi:hypothetical protein